MRALKGPLADRRRQVMAAAIVALLVAGAAVSVSLKAVDAQDRAPAMRPIAPMPFPPMGPGGGGIAMMALDGMIYIAQDGVLYKIDPQEMAVKQELRYLRPGFGGPPMPGPLQPGPPPGAGG